MSLLEVMSLDLPSVCINSSGISRLLDKLRAAKVIDDSPQGIAQQICMLLIQSSGEGLVDALVRALQQYFSI